MAAYCKHLKDPGTCQLCRHEHAEVRAKLTAKEKPSQDLDFLREMLERFDKGRSGDVTQFDMARQMMVDWIEELESHNAVEALAALIRDVRAARDGMGAAEALLLAPGLHRAGQYLDKIGYDKTALLG